LLLSAAIARRAEIFRSPGVAIPIFLGSLMALSALWSIDPQLTIERGGTLAVLFALVSVDLGPRLLMPGPRRAFIQSVSLVAALVTAVSLVYWAVDEHGARVSGELRGVLENANALGLILALLYPFLVASVAGSRLERVWLALIPAAIGVLLALSAARTGLIALLVAITVMEIARRRGRALALQVALVIAMFGVATVVSSWPSSGGQVVTPPTSTTSTTHVEPSKRASVIGTDRPQGQTLAGSLSGARNESWPAAVEIAGKRPVLGFGFGVGDELFARYPRIARFKYFEGANPGSAYITLGMELGLVGSLLFFAPLLAAAGVAIAALKKPMATEEAVFPALLFAGLAGGLFETILSSAGAPWSLLVWSAGLVVLLGALERTDHSLVASMKRLPGRCSSSSRSGRSPSRYSRTVGEEKPESSRRSESESAS
jgi:O-antigen ligase